ncbi:MAG: pitrilysin family protein [Bdellovibrionota bacterium]
MFEKTLQNGFELVVKSTNAPVAALQVWVDVGSLDERPIEAGYCHFLEHMLFKGTKKRTTAEIAGTVEGAGGEMNAFTSFEYTVYHITISNQRWELANEILADMVLGSTFERKEFEPEKEVILEEIRRGEDSPDRQLYRGAYSMLYGNAGYGKPVIGFPTTVRKCTAVGLKQFWKRWYTPSLMTLVVCGDVDPLAVEHKVKKTWGLAKGKAIRDRRRESGYDQKIIFPKQRQSAQPFPVHAVRWVGTFPGCTLFDPGLPALDVSGMILGQGESSRLHRRLFRDEQSVTSVGAGVWAPAGTGMYSFEAEAPVEKLGLFRKSLWEEITRFCDEGPTSDELERAKVAIETERVYGSQSMDGLANRIGFLKTSLGNSRFDLEYMAQARELTSEDVRDAARRSLDAECFREFALLPKGLEPGKFWKSSAIPTKTTKLTVRSAVMDREQVSLPNGIELVLYPRQDISVISLQACAVGGLRVEKREVAGIGNILSDMWDKGAKGWTAEKFSEYLEKRGARIESFSGRNSLGLGATMLTPYFEDVLPLYVDTLFNPALAEDEFKRSQALALEDIRTLEDDSGRLVGRIFAENLFESHPYSQPIVGYAESVSGLKHQQVVNHFKSHIGESRVVVSASGKFNPNRLIAAFEKVQRSKVAPHLNGSLPFAAPKAPRFAEVTKNREQSHLIVGFQGTRVTDIDRYNLRVLLTVLGGQSGRLFTELRDKRGLCYTVAPISFEGIEPGYVGVYMGCDPMKRTQALEGIKHELERIATKAVSASELKRAKEFILGRHHMEMQLNSSIATVSSFNTLYGLGFDEHLKLSEHLRKITAKSLQKLSERLFTSPAVTALVV